MKPSSQIQVTRFCPYHGAYRDRHRCPTCAKVDAKQFIKLLDTCKIPMHPLLKQRGRGWLIGAFAIGATLGTAFGYILRTWVIK